MEAADSSPPQCDTTASKTEEKDVHEDNEEEDGEYTNVIDASPEFQEIIAQFRCKPEQLDVQVWEKNKMASDDCISDNDVWLTLNILEYKSGFTQWTSPKNIFDINVGVD